MKHVRNEVLRAKDAYERGDYNQAEKLCVEILKDHSDFADLYCVLATIYHEKGRLTDSVRLFEKAVEINPGYLEARMNLVVAYNDLGQYERAQDQVVEIKKQTLEGEGKMDMLTRNRLANMHARTGDLYSKVNFHFDAAKEYEKALALRPQFVDIKVKLAIAFRKLGRIGESMRQLEESLNMNPNYTKARIQLALTCQRAGADKRAIDLLNEILKEEPDNTQARLYMESIKSGQEAL